MESKIRNIVFRYIFFNVVVNDLKESLGKPNTYDSKCGGKNLHGFKVLFDWISLKRSIQDPVPPLTS